MLDYDYGFSFAIFMNFAEEWGTFQFYQHWPVQSILFQMVEMYEQIYKLLIKVYLKHYHCPHFENKEIKKIYTFTNEFLR